MTKLAFQRVIHLTAKLGLALLFVWAGVAKFSDIPRFADRVADFGLVYDVLVFPTAWSVAVTELLAGLALAFNLRGSLSLILGLLILFLGILAYGIGLGLDFDCGCFGPGYHITLKTQLLIDFGLLLLCGVVYWSRKKCHIKTVTPAELFRKIHHRRKPTP